MYYVVETSSEMTSEAWSIISLLQFIVVSSNFCLTFRKHNLCVQGFMSFISNWTYTKIALIHTHTHTQKRKDWAYLSLFLHFYICSFVAYCLLVCYLLLSFLYFDKGPFYSQTFQCPCCHFFAITRHFYTETQLLVFSRKILWVSRQINILIKKNRDLLAAANHCASLDKSCGWIFH